MKIILYRKDAKTPFKVCHDPNNVIVKLDKTVFLKDNGKKYKVEDEDCKVIKKNGEKYVLYKIWVSSI